jgi:hypothetical protein
MLDTETIEKWQEHVTGSRPGGFFGPFLIGWARQATGSFIAGLMISAVTLLAAAIIVTSLRRTPKLSILQPTS